MKSFKEFSEEAMTTSSGIAGLPPDQPPGPPPAEKKKKKYKILTRGYIEVAGKRKRTTK